MQEKTGFNISNGISQSDRYSPFLDPQSVKIDERTTDELLEHTIKLSRLVNYYDEDNMIDGDWEDFFNSDIDVMITMLSRSRSESIFRMFETIISRLKEVDEPESAIPVWNSGFSLIYNIILVLQKYRLKLSLPANRNSRTVSLISIADSLDMEFLNFISGYEEFKSKFEGIRSIELSELQLQLSDDQRITNQNSIFENAASENSIITHARKWFNDLFSSLRTKFSTLISAADYYLEHLQYEGDIYEPHLALFVTFLQLYGYLQDEINKISSKHLNYYYQHIVKMAYKDAIPEKIYLLFQSVLTKKQVLLPAGQRIFAELPDTKHNIQYALQQDTVVTQVQIQELKTGFISQKQQFSNDDDLHRQVEEFRLYTADYTVIEPQHYNEKKESLQSWPIFGEEQDDLSAEQRTMDDATLGLIIASPLFYVHDGKREIQIRFYLTPGSFIQFKNYITNFSAVTGYNSSIVVPTLLNDSFIPRITGTNGWETIRKYNIRFSSAEKYLELNFLLDINDAAVDIYKPEIHGGSYNLTTPAVELKLNNALFHHPYSFYKDFVLERIGIQVQVSGSKQVQIRNSLGNLSTTIPFQFFGPLPAVGSYLDIRNTNIFNRYTKSCSVHIEWFNLPKEYGGFETYFSGYDTGITNDSYTVSVNTITDRGLATPLKAQQHYSLFSTQRTDTSQVILKDDTLLNAIDCRQLNFQNDLLLNKDQDQSWESYKGGSIRIELTDPEDAFGHRTYPQILPGIIAHNTKKLKRKFLVPNAPYIPVAKSIAIDYTLEHTEVLRSGNANGNSAFTLVHLYPSGYGKVYPGIASIGVHFIPPILEESNLLIGLKNAIPGSELSLLFELEEATYHHTAHPIEPVNWSYLQDNTWTPIDAADILFDNTNHFSNSGIVTIRLADCLSAGNTILNPDLCWLKASSTGKKTAGSRVIAIFPQAGIAVRNISTGPPEQITLPAGAVKGFMQKTPDITTIWQLFPSTTYIAQEPVHAYNLRVSERLRHKDRPLTLHDFAQVILEAFPQLLMVKCLGRGMMDNLILPGVNVQVIVIPKKQNGRYVNDQPKVSLATLLQVKEFIGTYLSPFAEAEVGNAIYEEIKVICSVSLKKDKLNSNDGYYINLLNNDVKKYITPWLFDDQTIKIGGGIYISDILNFIKSRPYISYISGFSVLHFYKRYNIYTGNLEVALTDSTKDTTGYIKASRADAVLISSSEHFIKVIDHPVYLQPVASGVGDLVIGKELYLADTTSLPVEETEDALSVSEEDNLYFNF